MQHDRPHALVVGASLAGMLAARVLSETCERVTVLDRDLWTDHTRPRQGVPHGGHAHGLLSRGLAGLEELLPGLTAELVRAGGVIGDISDGVAWTLAGGRLAAAPSDLVGLLVSRVALESAVRRRVLELPQVSLHEHRAAAGITLSPSGDVDGVEVFATDGPPGPITRIAADVVVDASGRRSQARRLAAAPRLPGRRPRTGSASTSTTPPGGSSAAPETWAAWSRRPTAPPPTPPSAPSRSPRRATAGWSGSTATTAGARPWTWRSSVPGPAAPTRSSVSS